jgi:hypothetical protein
MTRTRNAALPLALIVAAGYAHADLRMAVEAGIGEAYGATVASSATGSFEAIGPVLAARVAGDGAVAWSPRSPRGSGGAVAELSATFDRTTILGSAAASFAAGGLDAGWGAAGKLVVTINGDALSWTLSPWYGYDSRATGGSETGFTAIASFLAGEFVLKPRVELSRLDSSNGDTSLSAKPGLGLSWYPGFPLSVAAEAGYERTWYSDGSVGDQAPAGISVFGSIGGLFQFKADAGASIDLRGGALSSGRVSARLSFILGRAWGGELRLPVDASWNQDPILGYSLTSGLELALD